MLVENYKEHFPAPNFERAIKREDAAISQRAYKRLCRESRGMLEGFGLDFAQLNGPTFEFFDMVQANAKWTHKTTGQEVELSGIWFDHRTGEINQAGTNYGSLTL